MTSRRYVIGLLALALTVPSCGAAFAISGDYNNNGVVDAADYVVCRENLGTLNWMPNDTTPYWVMDDDYGVWQQGFGKPTGTRDAQRVPRHQRARTDNLGLVAHRVSRHVPAPPWAPKSFVILFDFARIRVQQPLLDFRAGCRCQAAIVPPNMLDLLFF